MQVRRHRWANVGGHVCGHVCGGGCGGIKEEEQMCSDRLCGEDSLPRPGTGAHRSELWGMQWGIGDFCGGQAAWERHRGLSSAPI